MRVNILCVQKLIDKEKEGVSEAEEITAYVDNITKNIQNYKHEDDLTMLKKLKQLCIRNRIPYAIAKMIRNIGMYYFYKGDTKKAVRYINESIKIANELKAYNLIVTFLSDKGLVLFYDLKYQQAKRLYLQAVVLLPHTYNLEKRTIYLLYYRTGILYSYLNDYSNSFEMLYKAQEYADSITETGWVIVNTGVNFERQGLYTEALEQYYKVLQLYGENYTIERSSVYNNIAQVHMDKGEYDIALQNINKAFALLECKNMNKFFIFLQTYTELKIIQGESREELEKLIKLISQVKDFFMYKCFVIDGINVAVKTSAEDKLILSKLSEEIKAIINDIGNRNSAYKRELDNFLSDICLSLSVLSSK